MKTIDFSKLRRPMYAISTLAIVAGLVYTFFFAGGFNLGIDFKPGLSQTIQIVGEVQSIDQVKQALGASYIVQPVGDPSAKQFLVKIAATTDSENVQSEMSLAIKTALEKVFGPFTEDPTDPEYATKNKVLQTDYVGPSLSSNLLSQTISLTLAAAALILAYVWFRFKMSFALAAIIALFHDTLFVVAVIGVFQVEVSTAVIAAVLTIIGYSINDTIVVFDRIRENIRLNKDRNLYKIVDFSITQSLGRTIVTSLTTLFAVLAIFIFTNGTIKDFAFTMIVGIAVGTYSSIFIASPLMVAIAGGKVPTEDSPKKEVLQGDEA